MTTISMANSNTDSSLELLVVIKRLADKMGANTLKSHLLKLERTAVTSTEEEIQASVIKEVCAFLGIPVKCLKSEDSDKTEERYWAIVYISVILRKRLNTPFPIIASIFSQKPQTIRNKVTLFNNLTPTAPPDKEKLVIYDKIVSGLDKKKIFANKKN